MEELHEARKDDRSEFQRDYDRLIFSAPFRRLQNKTQVFPLPGSVFVHNRLTHSLEVSCVGRSLGNDVANQLLKKHPDLVDSHISEIGSIVSAACLAHDLGNPPFGHSGEKAISTYFSEGQGMALKKELSLLGSLYGDIKKEEQSLKEASRKASRRKTSMEQELKNLKGEKMRMYEEYAAGTLSLDNYKNKKQEYDRKIAEVQDKIEQSKAEEAAQSVVPGTVRAAAEQAENFLHGTRLTASMVSAFIENVYVHEGGRIVVQFKYEQSIQDAVRALHTD